VCLLSLAKLMKSNSKKTEEQAKEAREDGFNLLEEG
jgi:hypothetical protein